MIASIESINAFSDLWASAMLRASWQGALVIIVIWLLCRIPSIPARVQCWLWRLAFLKLILALIWVTPLFELPILRPVSPEVAKTSAVVAPEMDAALADSIEGVSDLPAETRSVLPLDLPTTAIEPRIRPTFTTVLFCAWALSVFTMAALLLRSALLAHRLRRASRPIDDPELLDVCEQVARHYRLRQPPHLAIASGIPSAMLLGIVRPLILLSAHLPRTASLADMRLMIAHELAHLQRRDLHWNWLATVVNALFPFHPLVWLARREYRLAQESACDTAALGATGARPSEYGAMILAAVTGAGAMTRSRLIDRAAPALAVGIVSSSSRRNLERRLIAMSTIYPWSRRRWIFSAVMVALTAGVSLVPWRIVAQEPGQDPGAAGGGAVAAAEQPAADQEGAGKAAGDKPHGSEMRIFALKHADANEMAGHILRLFRGDAKNPSRVQASADERTNAIVVVAPGASMKEIEQILQRLDAAAPDGARPGADPAAARGGNEGGPRRRGGDGALAEPQPIRLMGRLFADIITLRAPVDGAIQQSVREGTAVKKGEGVMEFDSRRAKAALMVAEAQRELAETQLKRARALLKNNVGVEQEVQQAEAESRVAAANMELRREDLQELLIVAPRAGIVSRVAVHEGERVQKGTELATIIEADAIKVAFHVDQFQVGSLKVGQKVQVQPSPARDESTHEAEIYFISPSMEVASGTTEVRARLKSPAPGLRAGALVNVYLAPQAKGN